MAVLFGFIYAIFTVIGVQFLHITSLYFYLVLSVVIMFIQYMVGPKIVEWTMRVKYVKREDYPRLYQLVEELALRAKIPTPRVCIAQINLPNAFAFGRSIKTGRVCVTAGIMSLLSDEELRAVLGHEISHLKNRDVLIMYRLAWHFLFFGRRRSRSGGNTILIGMAAFLFYFLTNLLVLYASRIREYFADRGAVALGNNPTALASSLYKLVYGAARMPKESLKEVEGLKAFFLNDPSKALGEIQELSQLDLDKSGTIDRHELQQLKEKNIHLRFGDRMLELLSTHPNMLKRIKRLSEYK